MSRHDPEKLDERSSRWLEAYHDGELSALARWRFERRLARAPGLQRELRFLQRVREAAREIDATHPAPDLSDAIALRLSSEDARRAEARSNLQVRRIWIRWAAAGPAAWIKPAGALAALALAILWAMDWAPGAVAPVHGGGVVRWLDSGGRDVMVLEDDAKSGTTLIWLLDADVSPEASMGGIDDVA